MRFSTVAGLTELSIDSDKTVSFSVVVRNASSSICDPLTKAMLAGGDVPELAKALRIVANAIELSAEAPQ